MASWEQYADRRHMAIPGRLRPNAGSVTELWGLQQRAKPGGRTDVDNFTLLSVAA